MKTGLSIILLAASGLWLPAQVTNSFNYSLTPHVGIPNGSPVGIAEQFTASGVAGAIADIQVTLDITGGFNGDLYAYLAGPQGQLAVLLNRVGVTGGNPFGYGDAGFNITLATSGTQGNVHNYQSLSPTIMGGQLTGTWAADGRNLDPLSAGSAFDTAGTGANLSVFQNTDGNGVWTVFIADLSSGGGSATLNSLALTIMTVPEPQTWLVFGGGLALFGLLRRQMFC